MVGESGAWARVSGWQAMGLCLAAVGLQGLSGLGGLLGVALFAPIVFALVRLRRHAPGAVSTPGMVGAVLGARTAAVAAIVQITAYVALTVTAAQAIVIPWLRIDSSPDPMGGAVFDKSQWTLMALVVIVVAAVMVFGLPTLVTATMVAIIAVVGLLTYFYFSLAIVTTYLSAGVSMSEPRYDPAPATGLQATAALIVLAAGMTGFEVVATRRRRGGASAWPMGGALVVVGACAGLGSWAAQLGPGGFGPFDEPFLWQAAEELYGSTGTALLNSAAIMLATAGMLAMLWGIRNLTEQTGTTWSPRLVQAGVLAATVALAVIVTQLQWQFGHVGSLLLIALYAIVFIASARVPGDSLTIWWLRIVLPVVLVAVVTIPLADSAFSMSSLIPVAITAAVLLVAAIAAAVGIPAKRTRVETARS